MTNPEHDETRAIAERYARRDVGDRYHPLRPEIWLARLQRGGIAVLLVMMSVALFNDVARLLGLH